MNALKQFRSVLWLTTVAILFGLSGCQSPVPNPTVTFEVSGGGFSVTPNQVPGADSVQLQVFSANGNALLNLTGAPGQAQLINIVPDANGARPLQLCFTYKTSSGNTVALDSLRIDDTQKQGVIPDMDIVVGFAAQTTCPNMSATQFSTSNGTTTFAWTPNDRFEVTLTCGNTVEKFIVETLDGTGDDPGTIKVYKQNSFQCLTDMTPDTTDPKEMELLHVGLGTSFCFVRATDDNDGVSPRQVIITHDPGCTVGVKK